MVPATFSGSLLLQPKLLIKDGVVAIHILVKANALVSHDSRGPIDEINGHGTRESFFSIRGVGILHRCSDRVDVPASVAFQEQVRQFVRSGNTNTSVTEIAVSSFK